MSNSISYSKRIQHLLMLKSKFVTDIGLLNGKTLSNALLEINEDSYILLFKAQKNILSFESTELDNELYEILVLKKNLIKSSL